MILFLFHKIYKKIIKKYYFYNYREKIYNIINQRIAKITKNICILFHSINNEKLLSSFIN